MQSSTRLLSMQTNAPESITSSGDGVSATHSGWDGELYSFMRSEAVASILGRTDQAALPLVLLADYWV